ncbi:DUF960 family protein [Desulfosporosinus sp. FKA]|uniref:DUF960 family protein n=1 Tax=Desulfosporosinus sp. FKA TaxID=1969834 RepID=UPI000B49A16B|nr:DUF960 family protein [Desulfosporosinus sp. FKA]
MFEKDHRYMTRKVIEKVPEEVQKLVWDILDLFINRREPAEIDYLQVFSLSITIANGKEMQQVTHQQEQPQFLQTMIFEVNQPIEATLYAYGEKELTTLMFSEDYLQV